MGNQHFTCPYAFWTWNRIDLPNLGEVACKLMLVPASTALIESLFSHWAYIHTDARNRLGNEKSSRLLDIYHSLRHQPTEENRQILH